MDQIGEEHFPWTGKDKVEESRARATGLYGETMDLFIGKYTMGIYKRDVLIKKGVQLKRETFELLSEFFHPNVVRILDFIDEDKNRVSFVVSTIDASFLAWLKAEGKQKQLMFDENGKMKTLFRDMIIELCDLVDSLLGKGIVIANSFNMEDFYLTISDDGIPKLVLLLTAELLNGLIESSEKKGYLYNDRDPYEYTALLKNSYKHFDELPEHVKSILVNREGLLKQIERWSPDIWKNLYEIIGVPKNPKAWS
ncbi:hypothetical protein ACQ4PT_024457 [Festuca glaucescens]